MVSAAGTGDAAIGIIRAMHTYRTHVPDVSADCPCVGHCTTALGDDVCRSCLRTFEEITHWPELSEDERRAINRRIAARPGRPSP